MKKNKIFSISKKNLIIILLFFAIYFLSVGYSACSATPTIENIMASVEPSADAKVTNILLTNSTNGAISEYERHNIDSIFGSISLPNANSTVTYKVDVTVMLSSEMRISQITGLPENLEYELSGYNLDDTLCNENGECNYGATDEFYITIKYKDGLYDSSNTNYNFKMTFIFDSLSSVAKIGNNYYDTLDLAVKAVSKNNVETQIILLKDTSELITIESGQNIVLNMQDFTLSNNGKTNVIINKGTLRINNGIITTSVDQGAINNHGNLTVMGTTILATGRQTIYNDGGTLEIGNNSYLKSTSNVRATIQNRAGGDLKITGGTIISTRYYAVYNENGTMTIGVKDGIINDESIYIQGNTYGVSAAKNFNYYDGVIIGKTDPFDDTNKIVDIETGYDILYEKARIDATTYNSARLAHVAVVNFLPGDGEVDEPTRYFEIGKPIGTLPIPTLEDYIFDGWFTASDGGNEITPDTIVNSDTSYYAHWTHSSEVYVAKIGETKYNTLQAAINKCVVNVPTTITMIKSTRESITITGAKNIIIDFGDYSLGNIDDNPVISNNGTLTIIGGNINSSSPKAAVINNNTVNAKLTINDSRIIATGYRQALYNDGGTATITGNSYLSATTNERATVQNRALGTLTIADGSVVSTSFNGLYNESGTVNIGIKDSNINTSTPTIRGSLAGVLNESTINFYDGTILGTSSAIDGSISDIEIGSQVVNSVQVIEGVSYASAYLN